MQPQVVPPRAQRKPPPRHEPPWTKHPLARATTLRRHHLSAAPPPPATEPPAPRRVYPSDPAGVHEPGPTQDHRFTNVRSALRLIRNKWVIGVLDALADPSTELRFSELERTLHISRKMLSSTLRDLVRDGLISRRAEAAVPQRVYYRISHLGASLIGLAEGLCQWGEANMGAVHQARQHYDAAMQSSPHPPRNPACGSAHQTLDDPV